MQFIYTPIKKRSLVVRVRVDVKLSRANYIENITRLLEGKNIVNSRVDLNCATILYLLVCSLQLYK